MKYDGFVYCWHDAKHDYYCIGSHMGTLEDGYISSTGHMVKAYKARPEDFTRHILAYHTGDYRSLLQAEQRALDLIPLEALYTTENRRNGTVKYYNRKKQASGLSGKIASDLRKAYYATDAGKEHLNSLSVKMKGNTYGAGRIPWNKDKDCPQISEAMINSPKVKERWTEERRKERGDVTKKAWQDGVYNDRPPPTQETIEKRRAAQIGFKQTDYQKSVVTEVNSHDWIVIYPSGERKAVRNLRQFCLDNGLDQGNMVKVSQGIARQHKGYRCEKV